MKKFICAFSILLAATLLMAQDPIRDQAEPIPRQAVRMINLDMLGWYQLEGAWEYEERNGKLIAFAIGLEDHMLVLANAQGDVLKRVLVPEGFTVTERGNRLMVAEELVAVPVDELTSFTNVKKDSGTMRGCWSALAEGYFLCSGNQETCVYEFTYTDDDGKEVCARIQGNCKDESGHIVINSFTGDVETDLPITRCKQ